jgi:hypothetical protein
MNISVLRKGARPIVQRFMLSRIPTERSFSAPAAMQDLMCDDLRQRLAKIMEAKDAPANRKSISDADLQDRVQAFQVRGDRVGDGTTQCMYRQVYETAVVL